MFSFLYLLLSCVPTFGFPFFLEFHVFRKLNFMFFLNFMFSDILISCFS